MKAVGFCALHYGKCYLAWSIRSVIDAVDEFWVIYSPVGSHGHLASRPCPDSREELWSIATQAAGDKLRWHDGGAFYMEGQQRDLIFQLASDADVVLVCDYDEIYPDGVAREAIERAYAGAVRAYRLPFVHAWRSFSRVVLHDPAYPIRVYNTHYTNGEETLHTRPVFHLGYAIPADLCAYKLETHGHKNELRPGWFENVFLANAQTDCHPVGSDYWQPESVNPLDFMPSWMADHPYYGLEVIP